MVSVALNAAHFGKGTKVPISLWLVEQIHFNSQLDNIQETASATLTILRLTPSSILSYDGGDGQCVPEERTNSSYLANKLYY